MKIKQYTTELGGRKLKVEIGKLAQQANGAVTVTYGDTVVLATATMSNSSREGVNYFPLTVDYDEKLYAAGRIKGSRWIKREGKPTEEAILTNRLIDRTLRPLFNQKMRREVQIVVTVLSFDNENDPDIPALLGASLSLAISNIPWEGPIAGVRIGKSEDNFLLNPTYELRDKSKFDIVVSGCMEKINMIEGKAKGVDEKTILEAMEYGQGHIKRLIEFQEQIVKDAGKDKEDIEVPAADENLKNETSSFLEEKIKSALLIKSKEQRTKELERVKNDLAEYIGDKYQDGEMIKLAVDLFDDEVDLIVHKMAVEENQRVDGRKMDELRDISCEISTLPRTHGTGLFKRGETQALSILTLGPPSMEQYLDGMEIVGTKRFMHHYNFPPFSVGETGRIGGPGRREIGHGALVEKALEAIIPSREEFPYTIRIVTEILSSNGSSSMASVCGSILALMDAGVPIKANVAGIAMGLMMLSDDKYKILTDIQGPEDHHGDMDLKVAGTKQGVTAIQMDVKINGITSKILSEALAQAKKARIAIIDKIEEVIEKPKSKLSVYAPRVEIIEINPDKIRDVIGPGGKMINEIITDTGADIDIEQSGQIFISGESKEAVDKAVETIKALTKEIEVGEIFKGRVSRILDFGAFVDITPHTSGLVHISELAPRRVEKVTDIVNIGDEVTVKVKGIDEKGRVNLTMKDVKK